MALLGRGLICLAVVSGCGHDWGRFAFGSDSPNDGSLTPEASVDGAVDSAVDGSEDASENCGGFVFGWPEPIEEVNSSEDDWGVSITPDLLEIFWSKYKTIYSASRESADQPFTNVQEVSNISGDSVPQILPNGRVLYYETASNVYRAERSGPGGIFSTERRVEIEGLSGQLWGFFVTEDELTIYISSDGSGDKIQVGTRSNYQLPFTNLRTLEMLHQDGKSRGAPMLVGNRLLYTMWEDIGRIGYAEKTGPGDDQFEDKGLLALGQSGGDADPFLTPDGKTLVFATIRGSGGFNLFKADRICE